MSNGGLGKLQKPRGDWSLNFPSKEIPNSGLQIWGHGRWFGLKIYSVFGEMRMGLDREQLYGLAQCIKEMLDNEGYVDE